MNYTNDDYINNEKKKGQADLRLNNGKKRKIHIKISI